MVILSMNLIQLISSQIGDRSGDISIGVVMMVLVMICTNIARVAHRRVGSVIVDGNKEYKEEEENNGWNKFIYWIVRTEFLGTIHRDGASMVI